MMHAEILLMADIFRSIFFSRFTHEFAVKGSAAGGAPSLFKVGLTKQCFVYRKEGKPCRRRRSSTRNACSITASGKDPLRLQQAAPRKFAALTKGLSKKQLTRRPEPGKWSIAEILAHLADAELVIGYRLRLILASNGTPIQAFDQDAWAETFSYSRRDPKTSLETFRTLRENNLRLLSSVPRRLMEELRPAPGARPGNRGPHGAHDGWPRPEPHAADREDREEAVARRPGVGRPRPRAF